MRDFHRTLVQGVGKLSFPGFENPSLAYHFFPDLLSTVMQPEDGNLADPCTLSATFRLSSAGIQLLLLDRISGLEEFDFDLEA